MSTADELSKLQQLLTDGVLTQDEFDTQKRHLLSAGVAPPQMQAPPQNQQYAPMPAAYGAPTNPVSDKSRVTFVLLGFFLGTLGIHNFYAGYGGRGATQLLITLLTGWLIFPLFLVGLWSLIEIIAVVSDPSGKKFS
jgi:TM2 domain-containing membrane protein YozV